MESIRGGFLNLLVERLLPKLFVAIDRSSPVNGVPYPLVLAELRRDDLLKSNGYYHNIHPEEAAARDKRIAEEKAAKEAKKKAAAEAARKKAEEKAKADAEASEGTPDIQEDAE